MQEADSLTPNSSSGDFLSVPWPENQPADQADVQPPPRMARISFSEPPEELASLDFDSMELPPMDPTAVPSTSTYSLHFLLTSPETLPPVTEFCPRQNPDGRLQLTSMRDRPLYAPVAPGTPTRAQALLQMREGPHGNFTAGFLERTGLAIPPELDPDIPSRRESNLSQSDWDGDQDIDDGEIVRAPPVAAFPSASGRGTQAVGDRRAGAGLDAATLMSALGALAECGEDEDEEADGAQPKKAAPTTPAAPVAPAPPSSAAAAAAAAGASQNIGGGDGEGPKPPGLDLWMVAGMALSAAVVVGAMLLRPRPGF
mmetsp:Transcript_27880/g.73548  ORF Transcript_27880/g.73548 Transcript_27880/m.73548 type:complete len:313 (+) Transcript_27880:351-1289(+)